MDQALNSQKTPHTSPLRASYGMSFVSILMKNDRVIKGFYCIIMVVVYFKQVAHKYFTYFKYDTLSVFMTMKNEKYLLSKLHRQSNQSYKIMIIS